MIILKKYKQYYQYLPYNFAYIENLVEKLHIDIICNNSFKCD